MLLGDLVGSPHSRALHGELELWSPLPVSLASRELGFISNSQVLLLVVRGVLFPLENYFSEELLQKVA